MPRLVRTNNMHTPLLIRKGERNTLLSATGYLDEVEVRVVRDDDLWPIKPEYGDRVRREGTSTWSVIIDFATQEQSADGSYYYRAPVRVVQDDVM